MLEAPLMADRRIMMVGGNALATGSHCYELQTWGDADGVAARERTDYQNQKDKATR